MGPVDAGLCWACCVALGLTQIRGRRSHDDALCAVILLWVCLIGVVSRALLPREIAIYLGPPVDLVSGALFLALHARRPAAWKRLLILLVAAQMLGHVAYGLSDQSRAARYAYVLGLNLSFMAELLCVGSSGFLDLARWLFARLPLRPAAARGAAARARRHTAG